MLTRSLEVFRRWFVQRQENKFLNGLNSGELMDGIVGRSELLSALDAPGETNSLMLRMAEKRGVRPSAIADDNRRTLLMASACSRCRHRTLCKRWLDGRVKMPDADSFCPNSHHFDNLKKKTGDNPDPLPSCGRLAKLERRLN